VSAVDSFDVNTGMQAFFKTHKCSDVCKALGLKEERLVVESVSESVWVKGGGRGEGGGGGKGKEATGRGGEGRGGRRRRGPLRLKQPVCRANSMISQLFGK
jgi:hypothetical protein